MKKLFNYYIQKFISKKDFYCVFIFLVAFVFALLKSPVAIVFAAILLLWILVRMLGVNFNINSETSWLPFSRKIIYLSKTVFVNLTIIIFYSISFSIVYLSNDSFIANLGDRPILEYLIGLLVCISAVGSLDLCIMLLTRLSFKGGTICFFYLMLIIFSIAIPKLPLELRVISIFIVTNLLSFYALVKGDIVQNIQTGGKFNDAK